ncbi:MAG TPA: hypothetical protein PKA20_17420 [Burkholderiaceae bacterium]|nr:hypothetical protein [Burkholderiaceae bacterium]
MRIEWAGREEFERLTYERAAYLHLAELAANYAVIVATGGIGLKFQPAEKRIDELADAMLAGFPFNASGQLRLLCHLRLAISRDAEYSAAQVI